MASLYTELCELDRPNRTIEQLQFQLEQRRLGYSAADRSINRISDPGDERWALSVSTISIGDVSVTCRSSF